MQLKYHQAAFDLLEREPIFSLEASKILDQREKTLNITVPASRREWYSLSGAVDILQQFSNQDCPLSLTELDLESGEWHSAGSHDYEKEPLLLLMFENQSVCRWAVRLDGSNDPEVLVEISDSLNRGWLLCADHFSTFVYTRVWDWNNLGSLGMAAQELSLAANDLAFLRQNFTEFPQTFNWPGNINYRFQNELGKIL